MKKFTVIFLAVFILLPLYSLAEEEEVFNSVSDNAGVLSPATEKYINTQNEILFDKCGAKIIFVTVKSTGELDLNGYTDSLASQWEINSDKKQNSVLIVYYPQAHDYDAVVSKSISRALTDVFIEKCLINGTENDFSNKNYDSAAVKTFNLIAQWYNDNYNGVNLELTDDITEYETIVNTEQKAEQRKKINRSIIIILLVTTAVVIIIYTRRKLRIRRIKKKRAARRTRYLRLNR